MGAEQSVMQYDTLFHNHPKESEAWESRAEEEEEDGEEEKPRKWRLKLPINGHIALRRALRRGEDPFEEERKQRSRWEHDYFEKFGPLRNHEVVFKEVLWSAEDQSWSIMAKKFDGAELSPGSVPTVQQMSFREYIEMIGGPAVIGLEYVDDEQEQMEPADDPFGDLLELNYYARRRSDVFAEDWFEVNPFEGHPKTA